MPKPLRFLEPEHYAKAPKLPTDRPPTRREVWEREHFIYAALKPHENTPLCDGNCLRPVGNAPDELVPRCRTLFVYEWVSWYRKGWRKQPDWTEGQPVVPSAVPKGPFWNGETGKWQRAIFDSIRRTR